MYTHLYEIVSKRAASFPQDVALGSQEGLAWRTVTGRELLDLVDRAAIELSDRGVLEGDRVVVWAPNHWHTVTFLFALWKLGAVVVPFDREMNIEAGKRIIEAVEPRLVLAGYGETPDWVTDGLAVDWWEPGVRAGADTPSTGWKRPTEELATISFTSGTTGNPKGCMISHANLCSQVDGLQYTVPINRTSRLAGILPLSHLFELTVGMLYPLTTGAAIHYVPSRRGPDILRVFQDQAITHVIAVPQLLILMGQTLRDQLKATLPGPLYRGVWKLAPRLPNRLRRVLFWPVHRKLGGQLQMMASGGAALPTEAARLWELMGIQVLQGYGASECSPVVTSMVADEHVPEGSVGRPLRGVELRLTPEGELQVRGPNVMRGYWKDPERTAAVLSEGWYSTGDLASIDPQGHVKILGRAKDLIVLPSGMNVWPEDVEDALRGASGVKDAAVVMAPSASGGGGLHAYLVSTPGQRPPVAGIIQTANARLAVHQRLASASWWPDPDFPRTTTLKVKRNLLPPPQPEAAGTADMSLPDEDAIRQAVLAVARVAAIEPHQTLGSVGLDSLGLVELAAAIEEKTGMTVNEELLRGDMTLTDLRQALGAQDAGSAQALPAESWTAEMPVWPYTWGRRFRVLSFPVDLMYRMFVTRTVVLGAEHLHRLPRRTILAGTHHGFPDLPLTRVGLRQTAAHHLASRLVVASGAGGWSRAPVWAWYGVLAFGMFPLRQYRQRELSLRRLLRLAELGNPILIFPQGVHALPEQERLQDPAVNFHTGVTHLARALNAVVVPFGVAGTEKLMPPNLAGYKGLVIAGGIPMSFRKGPLAIAFGPAIEPQADEPADEFTARLQQACYALTRQAEAAIEERVPGS